MRKRKLDNKIVRKEAIEKEHLINQTLKLQYIYVTIRSIYLPFQGKIISLKINDNVIRAEGM